MMSSTDDRLPHVVSQRSIGAWGLWVACASCSTLEREERDAHPRRAWGKLARLGWLNSVRIFGYIRGGGRRRLVSRAVAADSRGRYATGGSEGRTLRTLRLAKGGDSSTTLCELASRSAAGGTATTTAARATRPSTTTRVPTTTTTAATTTTTCPTSQATIRF